MFRKLEKLNLKEVCRACLVQRPNLREISNTKIPKMVEFCAAVKVSFDDGLPSKICVQCFRSVAKLYVFKKKLERTDKVLRAFLREKSSVKHSDILNIALNEAKIDEVPGEDEEAGFLEYKKTEGVLAGGPPPLVPIEGTSSEALPSFIIKDFENFHDFTIQNTPPLIPIKLNLEENHVFTCCNGEFSSILALKEHKMSSCKETGLQCNICQKKFNEPKKLIGHLKGHTIKKDYCCKICNKRYPNPSTFKVHMRTHTGERPFKCQVCNKGFVRWAGVLGHMKTHQLHKPYKCEVCKKSFKVSSNLERHKVLHATVLPFCCNYCGKTFSQSENLQLHIKTYHTNEKLHLCSECGKTFVSANRLNRHMWVHSGFKPYRCTKCTKAYTNSNDLKHHQRSHETRNEEEDKLFGCSICDRKFYQACRLSRHMKTHIKPYVCECQKRFSSMKLLNNHYESKHPVEKVVLQVDSENLIEIHY